MPASITASMAWILADRLLCGDWSDNGCVESRWRLTRYKSAESAEDGVRW